MGIIFLQFDDQRTTEGAEFALITAVTGAKTVSTGLGGARTPLVLLKMKRFK